MPLCLGFLGGREVNDIWKGLLAIEFPRVYGEGLDGGGLATSGVWQSDLSFKSKSVSMRPHNKSLNLANYQLHEYGIKSLLTTYSWPSFPTSVLGV